MVFYLSLCQPRTSTKLVLLHVLTRDTLVKGWLYCFSSQESSQFFDTKIISIDIPRSQTITCPTQIYSFQAYESFSRALYKDIAKVSNKFGSKPCKVKIFIHKRWRFFWNAHPFFFHDNAKKWKTNIIGFLFLQILAEQWFFWKNKKVMSHQVSNN